MEVAMNTSEMSTKALITELQQRGYVCLLRTTNKLSWNRLTDKSTMGELVAKKEIFKWEAVHKIAAQLTPDHIIFEDKENYGPQQAIVLSGSLYLR